MFRSTRESQRDLFEAVIAAAPGGRPLRALDIGCGTGVLLCDIADRLPYLGGIGIDVSPENVSAANDLARRRGLAERLAFVVADWRTFDGGAFDLVVSHSTLQMIDDAAALAHIELAAGGMAVLSLPYACAENRTMSAARALLRRVRSPLLDRSIVAVAGLVHRGYPVDDRLPYVYEPPRFLASSEAFARAGLRVIGCSEMRRASVAQLRHRVYTVVPDYAPMAK